MKTNSLVILALLGKTSSYRLDQNIIAVRPRVRTFVYADDYDNMGESLGQNGFDESPLKWESDDKIES